MKQIVTCDEGNSAELQLRQYRSNQLQAARLFPGSSSSSFSSSSSSSSSSFSSSCSVWFCQFGRRLVALSATLNSPSSLWAILVLALLSVIPAFAQDTNPPVSNPTAEAAAMILSNAMSQIGDFVVPSEVASNAVPPEEAAETNSLDTNAPARGEGGSGPRESRRQWLFRQRAGAPGPDGDAQNGDRASTNRAEFVDRGPVKPDYSAFKLITDKNIFDPNRIPHRPGVVRTQAKIADSFALVGVMSYEKGTFAFFDGSSSEYKKALKQSDSIAGYKVTEIDPNTVKLAAGTNRIQLHVGMQMRREQGGDWVASAQSEAYDANSSTSGASSVGTQSVAAGGSNNDVLERLRKKREQE